MKNHRYNIVYSFEGTSEELVSQKFTNIVAKNILRTLEQTYPDIKSREIVLEEYIKRLRKGEVNIPC